MTAGRLVSLSALTLLASVIWAQGRLYDRVTVKLPDRVHVGSDTLNAGDYEIRQLPSTGAASRIMLVSSDGATHFETSATSIAAKDTITPQKTSVVLKRIGPDYYIDKIWISGEDYGYEFPLPAEAKSRLHEVEAPYTLSATYTGTATVATAAPAPPPREEARSTTPPPVATVERPAPAPAPQTPPAPLSAQAPLVAQNTPPPQNAAEPAPNQSSSTAPSENTQERNTLPSTASNWMLDLVFGLGLITGGLALRRAA